MQAPQEKQSFYNLSILTHLVRWTLLVIPLALAVGSMVALFLWLLDKAIRFRFAHAWLLWLLPLAGVLVYFLYKWLGKNSEAGNNLILDEIHEPGGGVPARMAPLVLATTIVTHLFGGSAGREGTAVQIGGSIAAFFGKICKFSPQDLSMMLKAGIAAGFGAVFGTPITGAIFALEVLSLGRIGYDALMPCFIAAVLADITCSQWGIHHTHYHIDPVPVEPLLLAKTIVAGIAFGLASMLFATANHEIKKYSRRWLPRPWLAPLAGGLIIIALTYILGTEDYLSLGILGKTSSSITIPGAFHEGGATPLSWFWKLLFTAITLGTGFKGGEVTPLFFVGATLGNALAPLAGAPVNLMAGLGFIAVFAGATNTPIACTIMGVELFGGDDILYYAIACFTAYYFSGRASIYSSQKIGISKIDQLRQKL